MSVPKLKVYRLDKGYLQSNDTDIQSIDSDEIYPVVSKPLNPDYAKLLIGVEHRDSAVVIKDDTDYYASVFMKPVYDEDGNVINRSLSITDNVVCDGWRLGKDNIDIYVKRIAKGSPDNTEDDVFPDTNNGWVKYESKDNFRFLFELKTLAYDSSGEAVEDEAGNFSSIVGRYESNNLSIEFGELFFLDEEFWTDGGGLNKYSDFHAVDRVFIKYHRYHEVLDSNLLDDYTSDGIVPFSNVYNGHRTGFNNVKDYNGTLTLNEGNYVFRRSVYPLRQLVAHSHSKSLLTNTNDYFSDVIISAGGSFEVFGINNWIQNGDLSPKLFERIITKEGGVDRVIFKELELKKQYSKSAMPLVTDVHGNTVGKFIFNLVSSYYTVSDGEGGNKTVYPDEIFIRYNEVDDCLGDVFDFDYHYNLIVGDALVENNNVGEYENTGKCVFTKPFDGFVYKKKSVLAIQETAETHSTGDILMSVGDGTLSFVLPDDFYFDASYPLEIYDNGEKVYDSETGVIGEKYDIVYDNLDREFIIGLDEGDVLPEDLMLIYYSRYAVGIGKEEDSNFWCGGFRVSCWEKVDFTDMFVSPYPNWVANHLNNNPDVFHGYTIYEGTGTPEAPSSGLMFNYLESGYNIYYRDGYIVLSNKVHRVLTSNDAKNFAGFDPSSSDVMYRLYTSGVRANFAHYSGLINLTGALVRNYSVRGGEPAYKLFDGDLYPDSIDRRFVLRDDSYMPCFFETGGRNLPDIKTYVGEFLSKFSSVGLTHNQGIRFNTFNNRISSVLFNFNTNVRKSWCKVFLNHSYDDDFVVINDEHAQLIPTDIPIYCMYYDSGDSPYVNGSLYVGQTDITDVNFSDFHLLTEFTRMEDVFENGTGFMGTDGIDVIDKYPSFKYTNINWNYDVVFELVGYRGNNTVEFIVYRVEKD